MDQKSKHQYTPLPGPGWIRVLTIHPREYRRDRIIGDIRDRIICDIQDHPLERDGGYVALSYSWAMTDGDDSKSHKIFIDGRAIPVTRNLFEGLLQVRTRTHKVRLWVDAVCINQADIEERNEQVAQMSRIYACADGVIAWLGEGGDEQAMCVLECLGKDKTATCKRSHVFKTSDGAALELCTLRQKGTWTAALNVWSPFRSYDIKEDRNWPLYVRYVTDLAHSVNTVLDMRYFSRRWIVQEIYHAKTGEFFWNYNSCKMATVITCLDSLLDLSSDYYNATSDFGQAFETVSNALKILDLRRDAEMEGKVVPFQEIVAHASRLGCSDPRDVIFALTSLCPSCGLQPDYNMSVVEVYAAFSKKLIRHGMFHLILENLHASRDIVRRRPRRRWVPFKHVDKTEQSILQGLPSWALDLRQGFQIFSDHQPSSDQRHGPPLDAWLESESNDTLLCNVYRIGTITAVPYYGFRIMVSTLNKQSRLDERASLYFPNAPLGRKGDVVVAFDQDRKGSYYHNVLLLRRSEADRGFVVLHWANTANLEMDGWRASPLRLKEKTLIRIV